MFSNLFTSFRPAQPVPKPAEIYTELRKRILSLSPGEVGVKPTAKLPNVWGILMEMGFRNGTANFGAATLVCLAEGTTSLYYSSGGGILGCGNLQPVSKASRAFLGVAEMSSPLMEVTEAFPLPRIGKVRFYVLTYAGALTGEVDEAVLNRGKHPLTRLFFYGQEVITQIRMQQEQKKN